VLRSRVVCWVLNFDNAKPKTLWVLGLNSVLSHTIIEQSADKYFGAMQNTDGRA